MLVWRSWYRTYSVECCYESRHWDHLSTQPDFRSTMVRFSENGPVSWVRNLQSSLDFGAVVNRQSCGVIHFSKAERLKSGELLEKAIRRMYALLEAEARIATIAVGLDPGLGINHLNTHALDSFGLDLMEAVRPEVDS